MTLETAVEEFLQALVADGKKKATIIWYRSLLTTFVSAYTGCTAESLTLARMRGYVVGLRQGIYSEDTIYGHIKVLHKFWRWYSQSHGLPNPMQSIEYPKQPQPKVPKSAKVDDVIKLLGSCDDSVLGKRDKAAIAFLFDTGCRAAGLCSLKLIDLDLDRQRAYLIEKGGRRRRVFFSPTTFLLLMRWLEVRRAKPGVEQVFISKTGQQLSPNGLLQMTRRLKNRSGVTGRTNPHAFRHGHAVEWLLDGGDLASLSRSLGHESIEVTARFYSIFVEDELAEMHRKHTPMNKIKSVYRKDNSETL